jgi:hypothetical protein
MFKRFTITGLLLGLALLALVPTASAYTYKKPAGHDCGQATFSGGFGGPSPSNVPKNALPRLDTFIVHGRISCTQAKHVMGSFEKSFNTPAGGTTGVSPAGWRCGFNRPVGRNECVNSSSHARLANGIVYVIPKGGGGR